LAADVEEIIQTAEHLYDNKESSKSKGRRQPKPLRFTPNEISFPVESTQPEKLGSSLSESVSTGQGTSMTDGESGKEAEERVGSTDLLEKT
jgi:hypothetical protein